MQASTYGIGGIGCGAFSRDSSRSRSLVWSSSYSTRVVRSMTWWADAPWQDVCHHCSLLLLMMGQSQSHRAHWNPARPGLLVRISISTSTVAWVSRRSVMLGVEPGVEWSAAAIHLGCNRDGPSGSWSSTSRIRRVRVVAVAACRWSTMACMHAASHPPSLPHFFPLCNDRLAMQDTPSPGWGFLAHQNWVWQNSGSVISGLSILVGRRWPVTLSPSPSLSVSSILADSDVAF